MARARALALPAALALTVAAAAGCHIDTHAVPPGDAGCNGCSDAAPITACNDDFDNDGDFLVDFPDDPGCDRPSDDDEFDAPPSFQCSNGFDDDGDFLVDFPMDPGCTDAFDDDETDMAGPAACEDMIDNDMDMLVDFPDDPGCVAPADPDETDVVTPDCSDGLDNDGDALVDFPADPGCTSAGDADETDLPADCGGVPFAGDLSVTGVAAGTTSGMSDFAGTCAGTTAPEDVYVYSLPFDVADLTIDSGGSLNSALYVRTTCDDPGSEIACNAFGMTATLFFGPQAGGTYFLFVDGDMGATGPYTVSVGGHWPAFGACQPGHAFIDCPTGQLCSDPGDGMPICNEGACRDTFDNDGDALLDFPDDPGCTTPSDPSEVDPAAVPACANGGDDDGDGATDFPADRACSAASDPDETGCGDDFELGPLEPWTAVNTDAVVGWNAAPMGAFGSATALHYGDPSGMGYNTGAAANSGTATFPGVTLGVTAPTLTFYVWLDVEGFATFDTLALTVEPGGTQVWSRADFPQGFAGSTGGAFVPQVVDLSAFAGMTVDLVFAFDTIDGIFNDGGGVYIDHLVVNGATCTWP